MEKKKCIGNLKREKRKVFARFSILVSLILFSIGACSLEANAAIYYLSPTGSDSNPGTEAQPFATFSRAFLVMAGGDTLIVKDGAYTQSMGSWIWSGGNRIPTSKPPNGIPSQYTLIKAQNVRATVDGMQLVDCQYVKVEGFETRNRISVYGGWIVDDSKVGVNSECHHVELKRVFAKGGITVSFAAYITLEDFWAIGNSRYLVHNYKSDYIISNRVVAWMDGTNTFTSSGGGAFAHYLTDYSVIAHGLIFDVSTDLQFMSPYGYLYSSRPGDGRNQLHGIIAFGGRPEPAFDGLFVVDQSGINQLVKNCVIWQAGGRGIRFNSGLNSIDKVENCTVSNVGSSAVYTNADKIEVRNSILANNGGSVSGGITGSIADGNIFYNTGSIPSYSTNHETYDPQIRYLPRSPVAGKGASVEKKYAIALVNGEYQVTETAQALWPWPYEDLIKQDMCANTTRGWCATNKTLTQYVWEYLGNPCPQEICGAQPPDTEPPVVSITSPATGASVSGVISIQATATDNTGVAGVQFLLDGANLQAEDAASPYSISLDTATIPNGTHTISARARDSSGNTATATDVAVTVLNGVVDTTPPVISTVVSSGITVNSATITWTTDEPATSQVEYGITISYGSLTPLDSSLVTNHSVSLTGLAYETLYHYRVKAKDAAGNEAISSDYSFTTAASPDTTPPAVPQGLQVIAISSAQIDLSWAASTDNVGVTGYKIYRDSVLVSSLQSPVTSYSDTGLQPSTAYSYTVSAYDAAGNESAQSAPVTATTLPLSDTTAPVVSITSPINGASVSGIISIQATATDNIGVVGVQFLLDGANLQAEDTVSPYAINLDTATVANGAHSLTVIARDAAGNSATSSAVSITVNNDFTAPVISAVVSSGITANSATITWTTDEPATSQVEYGATISYGSLTPIDSFLLTNHSVTLTGLTSETLYHYRVKAKDAAGNEAISSDYSFTTAASPDTTPPAVPQGLQATAITESSISLSWLANTEPDLAGYKLYRNNSLLFTANSLQTSYQNTGLLANTSYTYELSSFDSAGNESARSPALVVRTLPPSVDTTPPTTPIVIDGGQFTSDRNRLSASWSSSDAESGIVEYRYRITRDSPTGTIIRAWKSAGTNTSVTVSGVNLQWGKTYYFSVMAKNGVGLWSNVGYSDGITARK